MATIRPGRPSDSELLTRMSPDMYREAFTAGRSLSAHLEHLSPSEPNDGLDAFSRLCAAAGIRSVSVPEAGVWASRFSDFEQTDATRALVPEWLARQYRRAAFGVADTRALYTSSDDIPGSMNRPWADAMTPRIHGRVAPAIPVAALVAITTPIDGDAYRAHYLTQSAGESRMARVGEGAEIPTAKLTGADTTTRLYKYGRALEASYESLRRMRLDKVSLYMTLLAAQAEVDKLTTILDVATNGDGNVTPSTTNLSTLDAAAVAGTITLKGWLAFKMLFADPYIATTALTTSAVALQLKLLNVGTANVPAAMLAAQGGFSLFRDINTGLADGTQLGWTAAAPALKVVAMDNSLAIEQVIEIGANIEEIERYASRQTQKLVMTEVVGYNIFDSAAIKILDINA
jgi:hypothetical protein